MKGFMKRLSVTLLVVMMVFGTCTTSFAATDALKDVLDTLSGYADSSDTSKKEVYNEAVTAWEGVTASGEGDAIEEFAGTTYRFKNTSTDSASGTVDDTYVTAYNTMKVYVNKIKETSTDVKTVQGANQNLKTVVSTLDAEADISGAA